MNYFTYRLKLHRLNRGKDKAYRSVIATAKEAEKTGGWKAGREVYMSEAYQIDEWRDEIHALITNYLRFKAQKRFLHFPLRTEESDLWNRGSMTGEWYLTDKGIAKAYALIRSDYRERVSLFLKVAGVLIGIIVALTGLIAVIKSWGS
jgi:hypothetical protein